MYNCFVEFDLVTGCVNKCKYCPQKEHLETYKGERLFTLENFQKCIDKLPKSTISIAGFSEPFTNPECVDMIKYATSKNHFVIIYTTLKGLTIEKYNQIYCNTNVKNITIHLPDCDENAKIVVDEDYKQLLKYIMRNPPRIPCKLDFDVHGKQVASEIAEIITLQNTVNKLHNRANSFQTDNKSIHTVQWTSGAIRCSNGFGNKESGLVLPNGDVVACCMDWKSEYKYGNLFEQSWEEIMQSDIRKMLQKDRKTGEHNTMCRYCFEATPDYSWG